MIIDAVGLNVLFLNQSINTNMKVHSVNQMLVMTDSLEANIIPQQLTSSLILMQSVEVTKTVALEVTDNLVFNQDAQPRALIELVSQFLFLWQETDSLDKFPLVSQNLLLTQVVDVVAAKSTFDTLVLSQNVTVEVTKNLVINQPLSLVSNAAMYTPQLYTSCSA